jgi:hypothetical protein
MLVKTTISEYRIDSKMRDRLYRRLNGLVLYKYCGNCTAHMRTQELVVARIRR